jgi:aspartyl-tRNA(Asn)/glutamyl-tRNA(Gln) amidotransferase subunit A
MTDILELSVRACVTAIRHRDLSSTQLVQTCLDQIAATDPKLHAWVHVDAEGALQQAARSDRNLARQDGRRVLNGVPIGIKDVIDVSGVTTTAGAGASAHQLPKRDATLVRRLRRAGAIILGKTTPTPFAFRDPSPTLNPWSLDRTPGGSSSGSAAAVAARHAPAAIGTQTVGSILRPAAFCGVVGLKGGYGDVPLTGVLPLAPSFDHAGPITRTVADASLIEGVLSGATHEPSLPERPRLGTSGRLLDLIAADHRAAFEEFRDAVAVDGARVVELDITRAISELGSACQVILEAEAAAVHKVGFRTHKHGYPPAISQLIQAGMSRSPADVIVARASRATCERELRTLLASVDALLSPVTLGSPPRTPDGTGDPVLCAPWSYIGVPAITLPIALDEAGLPVGLQIVAGRAGLAGLLGIAEWCESIASFSASPPMAS